MDSKKYKDKEYFTNPRFDKVGITTLFTFYWDITIDTINFAKQLCKKPEDVMIGGIMSSLLPTRYMKLPALNRLLDCLTTPEILMRATIWLSTSFRLIILFSKK